MPRSRSSSSFAFSSSAAFFSSDAIRSSKLAANDATLAEKVRCAIDPCHFYWTGRSDAIQPFVTNGARASELMGAMLNVQLDRIDGSYHFIMLDQPDKFAAQVDLFLK